MKAKIEELKAAGIENVMALRGDLTPELATADRSQWAYRHAVDLVRELKASGADFCIGGACYPEIHPESASQKEDIKYLKEKVDAGCSFLTTQMFFDNNLLYNFQILLNPYLLSHLKILLHKILRKTKGFPF